MPLRRLLPIPLALFLALAAAVPASAIDWNVGVDNFAFAPRERSIDVGDTVVWKFGESGHTTVSRGGQAASWDSEPGPNRTNPQGDTFRHVFGKAGRFQYVCDPHSFMTGTIQVGKDVVANTLRGYKTKRDGTRVTVSFTLNEPAKVTYRLKGASARTVKRGRLGKGKHSFKVKGLNEGSHTGTLTAVDDFDKRDSAKKTFGI